MIGTRVAAMSTSRLCCHERQSHAERPRVKIEARAGLPVAPQTRGPSGRTASFPGRALCRFLEPGAEGMASRRDRDFLVDADLDAVRFDSRLLGRLVHCAGSGVGTSVNLTLAAVPSLGRHAWRSELVSQEHAPGSRTSPAPARGSRLPACRHVEAHELAAVAKACVRGGIPQPPSSRAPREPAGDLAFPEH